MLCFIAGNVFEAKQAKKIASCDIRWKLKPCHMHTFALTDKYAILPEQPLTIDITAMVANTIKDKPFIEGMQWLNDKRVRIRQT